jgi:lipid A 3-O-deacylase
LQIGSTINTEGNTSELYAGFTWDTFLTRRLFIEGSLGGAVHDGDDAYFGCRANFRESGSVGFMLSERWDVLAIVDHMSNANLCDPNRGLTNIGIRFGRRW